MHHMSHEIEMDRPRSNQSVPTYVPRHIQTSNNAPRPFRILVVEDDLSLKKVFMRVLKRLDRNIEVEWITSADQFFQSQCKYNRQKAKSFNLVLTDINMPGVNSGFEVWNHFTRVDPAVPVVIMSGLRESDFKRVVGEKSLIHYVQKPLSLEKCAAVLDLCA